MVTLLSSYCGLCVHISPFNNHVLKIALGRTSSVLGRQVSSYPTSSLPPTNLPGPSMHRAQKPANPRVRQATPTNLGLRPRAAKDLARANILEKDKETLHFYSSANPRWCCASARSSKLTCPHTATTAISIPILICCNQLVQTHAGSAHTSHWLLIKKISGEQLLFIYSAPCSQTVADTDAN